MDHKKHNGIDDKQLVPKDLELIPESEKLIKIVPPTPNNSITTPTKTNKEDVDDDEDEWELVPPDGGWGWLVLFGSMLVNILIPGTIKSFGVLFVEFIEAFNATPAAAAWIPSLCYFLYSSLGPLSSILSVKYSFKTVTIIGGTFAAAGMMLTFFATSVNFLYVSYGVFVGIGAGLSFPPTVYIVTSYFLKLRGLANGLCISGSALGSIILPPVLRILLETYGYRGAVLIMGAVTLNVWVAAIFYHPVEQHMKRVRKVKPERPKFEMFSDGPETIDENEVAENHVSRPKFMIVSDNTPPSTPKLNNKSPPEMFKLTNGFVRSASAAVVQNYERGYGDDRHRKISVPMRDGHRNNSVKNQLSSTPSLYASPDYRNSFSKLGRSSGKHIGERPPKRSPSTSSFQYISTPYHGSTLSAVQPLEFASALSLKSITNTLNPSCAKGSTEIEGQKKERNKFFDLSLLVDATYLVILISNSTNAISYTNFVILLPSYGGTLGFDKTLSAYLLSTVSTFDLIGRIGGSALSDLGWIPKTWYFVGGLAISGISLTVLPLATSYTMVSVCCGFFGLASGIYVGITAVIMADMLGTERLTSTYGISLFVNGILQLIGPPICGLWFEAVNSYVPLFTTLGIILLAGSSLWGFMPFINRRKRQREEDEMQNNEADLL